jgi:exodeoxyribonuclease VII large subunit
VLTRRFPNIGILLAPVTVQGDGAAEKIAVAITYLNTRDDLDLLIVGRGGGSLEDLWAFNEEIVARAIAASRIPVISAVGHEIDFTIADFVADLRAPTPSAAAELAVPVKAELEAQITRLAARLGGSLQNQVHVLRERIPGFRQTMVHALRSGLQQRQQRVDQSALTLSHRLQSAVAERKQTVRRLEVQLRVLSPLGVLERGYSLTETADGAVVRDAGRLKKGDLLRTRFAKGTVLSEVKTTME